MPFVLSETALDQLDSPTFARNLINIKYYVLSSTLILIYDYILTLDREVAKIWGCKFSLPKVLFFLNRYFIPLAYLLAFSALFERRWSRMLCERFAALPAAFNILSLGVIGKVLIIRTYALFHRSKIVFAILLALFLIQLGVFAWVLSLDLGPAMRPGLIGCVLTGGWNNTGYNLLLAWVGMLVFDTAVCVFTMWKTVRLIKTGMTLRITELLMRDGIMYFVIIIGANLANFLVFTLVLPVNIVFSHPLTSIMIGRLMLNLYEEGARPVLGTSTFSLSAFSREEFAMTIIGPLGGPLVRKTNEDSLFAPTIEAEADGVVVITPSRVTTDVEFGNDVQERNPNLL